MRTRVVCIAQKRLNCGETLCSDTEHQNIARCGGCTDGQVRGYRPVYRQLKECRSEKPQVCLTFCEQTAQLLVGRALKDIKGRNGATILQSDRRYIAHELNQGLSQGRHDWNLSQPCEQEHQAHHTLHA